MKNINRLYNIIELYNIYQKNKNSQQTLFDLLDDEYILINPKNYVNILALCIIRQSQFLPTEIIQVIIEWKFNIEYNQNSLDFVPYLFIVPTNLEEIEIEKIDTDFDNYYID